MDPYVPDSTNEDILSLIPSRTTWCISSNVSDEVDLDGISDNMDSLVESGIYGSTNTFDTSTIVFYVIMFTSGAYTLQENTTFDGKIITDGELGIGQY